MADTPQQKPAKAESFVGNVMKYSVATYLGFLISGAALIIKGVLPADAYAVPATFMAYTMSLMNLGMLGLDQALLRFYREPPRGATGRGMFLACVRLSLLVMLVVGAGASLFFAPTLAVAFGLGQGGAALVPFLFLNAALYMLVRYVNVLLRLENDVRAYTVQTLWMNACLNLIYLLPGFFTSNVWAFIAAALAGFGGVAVAFWFRALGASRGQGAAPGGLRAPEAGQGVYRLMLPYGLLLAPAAILTPLYRSVCLSFLAAGPGATSQGLFEFAYTLAQLVTTVQAGFSTYWGPYVYAHYRTEQERIGRIHDVLNFLVFGFFCVLILFEDVIFLIFPGKAACLRFFPVMMLSAVFAILIEGTVYGNAIARRPHHDTIGVALGVAVNVALCAWLVPLYSVTGAAVAVAASNGAMFLYRTVTGQYYYRTIPNYGRTISGFLLALAAACVGVLFYDHFVLKFLLVGAILFIYCTLYRPQLHKLWQMALALLRRVAAARR
ncbi:lipopolysaccharide biosynthesis protein [uncultured Subdoligranulum sp.]|uniref:lipopolysaccharide biosynthesis protein n=1 Tax=uncultured Subdoligranulum sp. TaxID=512298 RepID=UPI0026093F8E|nr:polysaccharide biosynthesis C-terminal domain-containing protein [uncultured Subdoligranulum sp.]